MALNDDFKNEDGLWVKSFCISGEQVFTKSYVRWNNMAKRCKAGSGQKKRPNYVGCEMSENFSNYQLFTDWYVRQAGYGLPKYHLDKDILYPANKLYSEHTCALVPATLNCFLTDHAAKRGEWPLGVSLDKVSSKYIAHISTNGGRLRLGAFATPDDAHMAYKSAKEAEAHRWYERLKAGEFVVDERIIERMRTWTLD